MKTCAHYKPNNMGNGNCSLLECIPNEEFILIKEAFEKRYPDRFFPPNGECFWMYCDFESCPYFKTK